MFEPPHGNGIEITELGLADFGAPYPDAPLTGQVVLANDGVIGTGDGAGTIHDGCETPFRNGQRLSGRIALIDRGFCTFAQKVRNAQQQGASAVIIVNNQAGSPPGMAGADPEITIPAIALWHGWTRPRNWPACPRVACGCTRPPNWRRAPRFPISRRRHFPIF
jgi:hypothetical protein